jgi:hypothetical protein
MFDRVATVTLPTRMPVEFPDECVGCGQRSPGRVARVVTRDARYHLAWWAGWLAVRVPACRGCAAWLHLWRWWAFARTLLVGAAGVGFGIWVLAPRLPGFATGLIVLFSIGTAFLLIFLIDRRFPPSFQIDPRGPMTDYEFRDPSYAERFAALNGAVPEDEA